MGACVLIPMFENLVSSKKNLSPVTSNTFRVSRRFFLSLNISSMNSRGSSDHPPLPIRPTVGRVTGIHTSWFNLCWTSRPVKIPGIGPVTTVLLRVISGLQVIVIYFFSVQGRGSHVWGSIYIGNATGWTRLATTGRTDGMSHVPRLRD
jgi:hypothetical protein